MTSSSEVPLQHTPLHAIHLAVGGRMVPFAGYEMPIQYVSILEEHRTVREAVGLFDLSHMGEVEIRGEEAVAFLRYALVSDPGALVPGAAQYSMACQEDGGIIDDLIVYRFDDGLFWIVCNASNRQAILAQLAGLVERGDFGVEVTDRSDATALVAPQGPRAAELLTGLTDIDLEDLAYYHAVSGTVAGVECRVARTGYTGEDGFEVFADTARVHEVWDAMFASGRPHGLVPVGLGARDTLRLEAGLCLYGHDIDEHTSPVEAGLAWAIQKARRPGGARAGGYPGAAVVERHLAGGAPTKRVGLIALERVPVREGAPLVDTRGHKLGRVTSGTIAPTVDRPIAMGYLLTEHAQPQGEVLAEVRGRRVPMRVSPMPFTPHRYHRG